MSFFRISIGCTLWTLKNTLWANGVQQSMVDYLKMYFDGRTTALRPFTTP